LGFGPLWAHPVTNFAGLAIEGLCGHSDAIERSAHPCDVPRADLTFAHQATRQSATTCRKIPRVVNGVPSSSRRSKRRNF
jgi:hypothetical protein